MRQLRIYWTTDDQAEFEANAAEQVWRLNVPESPVEQGYDLVLPGKSLWLTDGREVFWNCGPFWSEPDHAEVMKALGLHETDVAEYRRWHAGGVLHATRTEMNCDHRLEGAGTGARTLHLGALVPADQ